MRLWTLHPKYLDPQGLVALWREGLLAQKVLRGKTRGYKNHPQLERFKGQKSPVAAINAYLAEVRAEAGARGYSFDARKVGARRKAAKIAATTGQLKLEWRHLMRKLAKRNPKLYRRNKGIKKPACHPSFRIVKGAVAPWERAAR